MNNLQILCFLSLSVLLLLFPCSCSYQKSHRHFAYRSFPLYIVLPKNILVHRNIVPDFHKILYEHFVRSRYRLVESSKNVYQLFITILSLDTPDKYISPDIILHGYKMGLTLDCKLLDPEGKCRAQKEIYVTSLFQESRQPLFHDEYFSFSLDILFKRTASKLDFWVREMLNGVCTDAECRTSS